MRVSEIPRLAVAPLFVTVVVLLSVGVAGPPPVTPAGVHPRTVECVGCHSAHEAAPADATPRAATPVPAWPPELGAPYGVPTDPMLCGLLVAGSETATSQSCLTCHPRLSLGGHPYDVDYPRFGGGIGARVLRPLDEVTRRGIVLVDRQVRCVTCHDRSSPWRYRIKLPPGAKPMPAVDLRRRVTYENPESLPAPRPGDDVGKKPLCIACHALD